MHAPLCGLVLPDLDHLGFTIDRPDVPKGRSKSQGDAPRAAGQVEQPPRAREASPCEEVLQESCGIGNAIPDIVGGRASKGIDRKVRLHIRDSVHVLSFFFCGELRMMPLPAAFEAGKPPKTASSMLHPHRPLLSV